MWSSSAEGLIDGEISACLAGIFGASGSKETITSITDRILESMSDWQNRPADLGGGASRHPPFADLPVSLGYTPT